MIVDVVKYNLMRSALASRDDDRKDIDMIYVRPRQFPLKKKQPEDVLSAAAEILDDKRVINGITPLDTVKALNDGESSAPPELILYVLVCYAVAVQQEWIRYSTILNKYIVNSDNKYAKQYVEDIHGTWVQ